MRETRVLDYAKDNNLALRDVLETLKQNGHRVADQNATLQPEMVALLDRTIGGSNNKRPRYTQQPQGDRPPRPQQQRPLGHRPFGDRPAGDRPAGSRPQGTGFVRHQRPGVPGAPGAETPAPDGERRQWRPRPTTAPMVPRPDTPGTTLVDKKNTTKKTAPARKRVDKKRGERHDDTEAAQVQQHNNRLNRETLITPPLVQQVTIEGDLLLADFATRAKKAPSEVIFVLLKNGIVKNIQAMLTPEDCKILATAFSMELTVTPQAKQKEVMSAADKVVASDLSEQRLPVVVVMGHVDHGKTTLLDYLRKTNVVAKEKGGITQHLGAYEVKAGKRNVIFLDTPGHEAFSAMRTRGTRITDIAVIIIAVTEGIKPQTVEAIKLAQQAGVPIVVALNKIDKLDSQAQLDALYTQLTQYNLTPEEWGGQTVCVKISAKSGQGVDDLLEMLGLVSDMLDLRTSTKAPARAFVLETQQLKGHGLAATVICREGVLHRGDYFVCGESTGKVRLLINSFGSFVNEVGPSIPVQVVGFDEATGIGDYLEVVTPAVYQDARAQNHAGSSAPSLASVVSSSTVASTEKTPGLRLMFKADVQGSCQAIIDAVRKMEHNPKNKSIRVELLSCDVGPITEGDVMRAADVGAVLFGLHVKADKNAQLAAKEKRVEIVLHDIIYHLFEQLEEMIKTERRKVVTLVESGKAEVLKVFPIKGHKVIAGCMIKEGILKVGDKVVCTRARQEVGSGLVVTLQRDRKEAKEIRAGNDCGFVTDTFHDWQIGDRITIFSHEHEAD